MPNVSTRLLLASALFTLLLGGCNQQPSTGSAKDSAAAPSENDIVATVNGTPITVEAFNNYAAHRLQPGAKASSEEARAILNEMVSLELVTQDAVKKGLDKKPDTVKMIQNQTRMILANAAVREYVDAHPVTDEEVRKEYDERIGGAGSRELKARHILVKTEAEAKAIIAQLDKGADFAKLAKQKSGDGSAKQGGDLGWFNPNQMVKPFSAAAMKLKKGEYTKTPVQSQFGWHVIKLEDSRSADAPPFEQMKERVRAFKQQQKSQEYIESLKTQGKVEIKEANLPVAAAPAAAPEAAPAPAPVPKPDAGK